VQQEWVPACGQRHFVIRQSEEGARPTALIPADIATCAACEREVADPADRRFRYPFTNCTDCGPRFTIVEAVPYDRARTTMREFEMCAACRAEYDDPGTRRFHAEPNACPACGPRLWLWTPADGPLESAVARDSALWEAARRLRAGAILAVKGLGGFHLACDARNADAVRRLRQRKRRRAKPFAVMLRDLAEVKRHCWLSEAERLALTAPERPILLLRWRPDSEIARETAPRQGFLGVMLPYTPLHRLLLEEAPPALVMTSGNLSEEPIAHDNAEAARRLAELADGFLFHNRRIHTPCDDSVARVFRGELMLLRRSRGFVPRAVRLPREQCGVLACGGEQKNTFCLARGNEAVLSQHVGDLDNVETLDYYARAIEHFRALFRVVPHVVAHDLHPDYLSTRYALQAAGAEARAVAVQHHHAHVAACMADNGLEGRVIGVAFDGTGYGDDGTLWGGEFLIAGYRTYRRAAHLRPVRLPGGDAAIRRPARMAQAYLADAFDENEADALGQRLLPSLSPEERAAIAWQARTGFHSPWSSGAGRLFDAVSALLGICDTSDYEGQAAVELEMAASDTPAQPYPFAVEHDGGKRVLDLRPTLRQVVRQHLAGVPVAENAARFHTTVAAAICAVCRTLAADTGLDRVCLSGGTFQNLRLLDAVVTGLEAAGLKVYWHHQVPTNDGGLSLGQAVVAGAVVGERGKEG
ncbi:MAG: carbamoyltransferase HypF, partial [Armatimonadota bacterium]|nr:carbamoyltransferase HypF [Armatimonadota bacterium]